MDSPADGANGGLLSTGSIERGVGMLIVGIGVLVFFLLAIGGMTQVEKISTDATRPQQRSAVEATSEIGGVAPVDTAAP